MIPLIFTVGSYLFSFSLAALPGTTSYGLFTVFDTIDLDNSNNNCVWGDTNPLKNSSLFPFGKFAAVDTVFFQDAVRCGECYELRCISEATNFGNCQCNTTEAIKVMIMDFGHDVTPASTVFDLSSMTASFFANGGDCKGGAKYNITYKQVCCDHLSNIQIYNYQGITSEWLAFVVSDVNGYGSISKLEFRETDRPDYFPCIRKTNGNNIFWVCDPWTDNFTLYRDTGIPLNLTEGPYRLPIDIRVYDIQDNMLESLDLITNFNANAQFDFGSNFDIQCNATNAVNMVYNPTINPTFNPVTNPVISPTSNPVINPTSNPVSNPTSNPVINPTTNPVINPTTNPIINPTINPIINPSINPVFNPSMNPINMPSINPTSNPTLKPSFNVSLDCSDPNQVNQFACELGEHDCCVWRNNTCVLKDYTITTYNYSQLSDEIKRCVDSFVKPGNAYSFALSSWLYAFIFCISGYYALF